MNEKFEVGMIDNTGGAVFAELMARDAAEAFLAGEDVIVLGATKDGLACGAITGEPEEEDLFRITSFFVTPEARREGAGTLLLDTLLSELSKSNEEMVVTMEFGDDDEGETEALVDFLYARGIPESDNDGVGGLHRFTFFAES